MTEQEWLTATDSRSMLSYLTSRIDHRKYILIKCAFLRRFWHLLTDERSRRALEVAERHADALVSTREWASGVATVASLPGVESPPSGSYL
jgi:hypothetical protein